MNPHDADNAMAGDYVMGLLDGAEHAAAEQRIATDQSFARLVSPWRERLRTSISRPRKPRRARRFGSASRKQPKSRRSTPCPPHAPRCVAPRCGTTSGSGAAWVSAAPSLQRFCNDHDRCVGDIAPASSRHARTRPAQAGLRRRAGNDTTKEAGAIVNAFSNGRVELIPLRPIEVPAGRTLQVWTLWDRAVGPKSIGVTGQSRTLQLDLEALPETVQDQLFEITLEPEGGSPIGRPTGPILFKGNAARAL